jgi:GLPGLI family protein
MKYIILFLIPISIFAQDKFKVEYERRYFINLNDPNPESKKLREEIFSKPKYIELAVNGNKCLSKEVVKIDNSQGPQYAMKVIGGYKDLETFTDFDQNNKITVREMDAKVYNISDTISQFKWTLTRETKSINGYEVRKAFYKDQDNEYEAWYATAIKSKCGLDSYYGLPGLLLELKRTSIKDQKQYATYKVENIVEDTKLVFEKPNKGKSISSNDFEKLEELYYQKVREMVKPSQGVDKKD